jgi:hypothetical protein
VCGSYGGDESLMLSVRGSGGGLSHGHGVILLPLSGDGSPGGGHGLLLIDGEVGGDACLTWSARRWWLGVVVVGGSEP